MMYNDIMIEFGFNPEKAKEVILYLSSLDRGISKMRLLKFMFFADIYHINKYARPILGDRYVAMQHGPVLSTLYNMIKDSCQDYSVKGMAIIPHREANLDYISKSDKEALDYAFNQYSQYETEKLSEISHEHRAWINALEKEPNSKNAPMLWEWIIEYDDILQELQECSRAIVF